MFLSAWCGLAAGLLEVATIVVRKRFFDPDQLLHMSRHFVWLAPLADIAIFLVLGLLGGAIAQAWPSRGRWLLTRVLGALVVLPSLLVAFPRIYTCAWLVVALGLAARVAPFLEQRRHGLQRFLLASFPGGVAVVAVLAREHLKTGQTYHIIEGR